MSDLLATDNPFSADEQAALRAVARAMIPPSAGRPGADDALIFADVMTTGRSQTAALKSVAATAQAQGAEALQHTPDAALRAFMTVVVQCYYRDDRVLVSIGSEPRPPYPEGYDLEPGDWTLLEPVRSRGRLYRE